MNLDIRINYNVNLFYVVSCASEWSEYANSTFLELFETKFILKPKHRKLLKIFADFRICNNYGWEYDGDFFEWAYNGFLNNPKFE